MNEPFAWFRYQQGDRIYFDSKKWDDCQPLYTHSDYERGFIDGMQKQMQSSVDKAVNAMSQRTWVGLDHHDKKKFSSWLDHKTDDEVFTAIEDRLKQKNGYTEEKNT